MSRIFRLCTALFIGTLTLAGCSDSSGTNSGVLTVRLTDAPFPFSDVARVDVFVVRVDARNSAPTDDEATDETNHEGWTTVASPNARSTCSTSARADHESRCDHSRDGHLQWLPPDHRPEQVVDDP